MYNIYHIHYLSYIYYLLYITFIYICSYLRGEGNGYHPADKTPINVVHAYMHTMKLNRLQLFTKTSIHLGTNVHAYHPVIPTDRALSSHTQTLK